MKKFIYVLITLFLFTTNIYAVTSNSSVSEKGFTSNDIWELDYLNAFVDGTDYNIAFVTYKPNGKVAFCIEPSVLMYPDKTYHIESYQESNLQELAEIYLAYEALGYPRDLYVPTQLLIWERLGIHHTVGGKNAYELGANQVIDKIESIKPTICPKFNYLKDYPINETIVLEDQNQVLNKGYHITSYSEGLSDVKIIDNSISFKIDKIYPLNKSIKIEPDNYLNSNRDLNAGEVYLASGSQALFSYSSRLPYRYQGAEINITHETGDIIIEKTDEWNNSIKNGIEFNIEAKDANYQNLTFNENGTNVFNLNEGSVILKDILPPGKYLLNEKVNTNKYLPFSEPIEFEIKKNEETKLKISNLNRDIEFKVFKKEIDQIKPINGVKYKLYDISQPLDISNREFANYGETKEPLTKDIYVKENLYLAKIEHSIDLNQLFKTQADEYLLIDENNYASTLNKNYAFKDIHNYQAYALKNTDLKVEGVETNNNYGFKSFDDLTYSFKIADNEFNKLESINQIEMIEGQHILSYRFEIEDKAYLLLRPVNFECNATLNPISIYEVIDNYQFFTIKNDNEIIDSDCITIEGIKLQEQISGSNQIQAINPYFHNYYLPNTEIELFDNENQSVGKYQSNHLGYLDIKDLKEDVYHYQYRDKTVYLDYHLEPGLLNFPKLKQNRKYLLIEEKPSFGYKFGEENALKILDGDFKEEIVLKEVELFNPQTCYDFHLFKTNSNRNLLLNNAEFEIYEESLDNSGQKINKNLGKYVTGCLNINQEFDDIKIEENKNYFYEISYLNGYFKHYYDLDENQMFGTQTFKMLPYQNCLTIDQVEPGWYSVKLYAEGNDNCLKEVVYQVIDGGIYLDNIPFASDIKIVETKAPMGYYASSEQLLLNSKESQQPNHLFNYRINQLIIIGTDCHE